ncbi:hypothetical protein B6D52_00120 [Candidatus Parcubacteria bacterium 4484_255]|nr:MAG: hypothetical protein B6D52_00120 [Candidatus Parcubacteria bacterium 4484_255]
MRLVFFNKNKSEKAGKLVVSVSILIVGVFFFLNLTILGYFLFFVSPVSADLRVVFLDVGQGDAILIQTPQQNIIIDGGPDKSIVRKLDQYIPITERRIDLMILTHPDGDHLTGLVEILRRWPVITVAESGLKSNSPAYIEFNSLIKSKNIKRHIINVPQRITFEDNLFFDFLWPCSKESIENNEGDCNFLSLVFMLNYGDNNFLFTGDATKETEEELMSQGLNLRADVLKAGHHGSKHSSGLNFLKAVNPEYAIISVGKDNNFGHPSLRVLDNFRKINANVLRTDEKGDIIFESNGQTLTLKTER